MTDERRSQPVNGRPPREAIIHRLKAVQGEAS